VPVFFFQINQQAMTKILTLFLAQQTAPSGAQPTASFPWQMLVVYGLFAVGIYFIFIAPQRKKQKELEKMIGSLDVGEEVITSGGIFGVITSVKSDRFVIRVADNTKIEVGKAFIQAAVKKDGDEKSK
jgi:preprotein translocase subunit YajC